MPDTYNLQRFIDAQEPIYEAVLQELKQGIKNWSLDVVYISTNQGFSSKLDGAAVCDFISRRSSSLWGKIFF